MFVYIPGEIISLLSFPGIIIHEVGHRFFCDLFNVPVYEACYFIPLAKTAGYVSHGGTKNFKHIFFISVGPLIINTVVCMLLTFPAASLYYLNMHFADESTGILGFLYMIMMWIGYSAGFHAIPSNQDVNKLPNYARSRLLKLFIKTFVDLINLCNADYISIFFHLGYMYGISLILPMLLLRYFI